MKAMNIVRFTPKIGQMDAVIKAHNEFESFSINGAISLKLVDCGETCCGIIEWGAHNTCKVQCLN
jgi:hypothetical protein